MLPVVSHTQGLSSYFSANTAGMGETSINVPWLLITLRVDLQEMKVVLLHPYLQYSIFHKEHLDFMEPALETGC